MSDRSFVDTNVLVYAFDASAPVKQQRAWRILAEDYRRLVISTQVLAEFYEAVTRKLASPLPEADAERAVNALARLPVVATDAALVVAAVETSRRHRLSLWDSLIVQAAKIYGCGQILSDDLQTGVTIEGVTVVDPFAA